MQKIYAQSVGDVLRQTIQECNMAAKLDERKAIAICLDMLGDEIAAKCGKPSVRSGVMYVPVSAASLRHELTMNRTLMIRLINEQLGKPVISEIRFIGGLASRSTE